MSAIFSLLSCALAVNCYHLWAFHVLCSPINRVINTAMWKCNAYTIYCLCIRSPSPLHFILYNVEIMLQSMQGCDLIMNVSQPCFIQTTTEWMTVSFYSREKEMLCRLPVKRLSRIFSYHTVFESGYACLHADFYLICTSRGVKPSRYL